MLLYLWLIAHAVRVHGARRLSEERRKAYCRLVIALCDGDLKAASAELRAVGYSSNQSERVPERDAEFFVHMFRDANVSSM
jgi:hypothetical protein